MTASPQLKRVLGLTGLLFYGIGDILGTGIYGLVGKIAGEAGDYAWVAFLVAAFVAGLTGLAYAELISRFPKSAGASYFVSQTFRSHLYPLLVGWFVTWASIVSLTAASHAFAGYFQEFVSMPHMALSWLFLLVLALVNYRGINETSRANMVCTTIEATGLLLIILFAWWFL